MRGVRKSETVEAEDGSKVGAVVKEVVGAMSPESAGALSEGGCLRGPFPVSAFQNEAITVVVVLEVCEGDNNLATGRLKKIT